MKLDEDTAIEAAMDAGLTDYEAEQFYDEFCEYMEAA